MERSSFFNSIITDGKPDRVYLAEDFARYFNSFIGNGVFPNPSNQLQVLENDNMSVQLIAGRGWINGYMYENKANKTIPISTADGSLNRIDRVVLRLDFLERKILSQIKEGEWGSNPEPPTLQRDEDAFELCLANVFVPAGAIKITQANITDTRLNNELCGLVHGVVDQVDTTTIFNQFTKWYDEFTKTYDDKLESWYKDVNKEWNDWMLNTDKMFQQWYKVNTQAWIEQWETWFKNTEQWESDFNTWFESIKGMLEGDVATQLANRILELESKVDTMAGGSVAKKVDYSEYKSFKAEVEEGLKGTGIISKTYEELSELKKANKLQPAQLYEITDYKTEYLQPDTGVLTQCEVEPLIIRAISKSAFSPSAYSISHPEDIIYYDFDDNALRFGEEPSRRGFIRRRIDTKYNIDAPHDWRYMKFARYKLDTDYYYKDGVLTQLNEILEGQYAREFELYKNDNRILMAIKEGVYKKESEFDMMSKVLVDFEDFMTAKNPNLSTSDRILVWRSDSSASKSLHLKLKTEHMNVPCIASGCYNIQVGGFTVEFNNIEQKLSNLVIGHGCRHITIGYECKGNTICSGSVSDSISNAIGPRCEYNTIVGSNNSIGLEVYSAYNVLLNSNSNYINYSNNNLINSSYNNIMASHNMLCGGCDENTLSLNSSGNTLYPSCSKNIFQVGCFSNVFKTSCKENTLNQGCFSVKLENSCSENVVSSSTFNLVMEDKCSRNYIGPACYSLNLKANSTENHIYTAQTCTLANNMLRCSVFELINKDMSTIDLENKAYFIEYNLRLKKYVYHNMGDNITPIP